MAATESKMISLGSEAPDFSLSNGIDNKFYSLSDLKGKNGTLILFICNHCPYVIHIIKHFVSFSKKLIKNERCDRVGNRAPTSVSNGLMASCVSNRKR